MGGALAPGVPAGPFAGGSAEGLSVTSKLWSGLSQRRALNSGALTLPGSGALAHVRLLAQCRAELRQGDGLVRLVLAHRTLLPVASLLARDSPWRAYL